jgi:flotillin
MNMNFELGISTIGVIAAAATGLVVLAYMLTRTINMESRKIVADNTRQAQEAEIVARQQVELREEEKRLAVGKRAAEVDQSVGVATELSTQAVQEEAKTTKEKQMAVLAVDTQRRAEITKAATVTEAEGRLQATKLQAEGIQATGAAEAEAKRLAEMATVDPQLKLAEGTVNNEGYQQYLIEVRRVEATERVGMEQAKALANAEIKIIANSDNGPGGLDAARAILSSRTGQGIAAVMTGLVQTPEGKAVVDAVTKPNEELV